MKVQLVHHYTRRPQIVFPHEIPFDDAEIETAINGSNFSFSELLATEQYRLMTKQSLNNVHHINSEFSVWERRHVYLKTYFSRAEYFKPEYESS